MKLRQATHAVFYSGCRLPFLYGERWKWKMTMNLQFATTTGGVLSAREALKTPELVLKHITEGGS